MAALLLRVATYEGTVDQLNVVDARSNVNAANIGNNTTAITALDGRVEVNEDRITLLTNNYTNL